MEIELNPSKMGRGLHLPSPDTVYSDYSGYTTVLAKEPLGDGISEWECEVVAGQCRRTRGWPWSWPWAWAWA